MVLEDLNQKCSTCGGRIKDHPVDSDGFITKFGPRCPKYEDDGFDEEEYR